MSFFRVKPISSLIVMQTSKVFIDLVQGFALKHTHYSQFSNFASARLAGKEKNAQITGTYG